MASRIPDWARAARGHWRHTGRQRPDFAVQPGPGEESVWDYPRPPVLQPDARLVEVRVEGTLVARTTRAVRLLETASPPTFYLPMDDVREELLREADGGSRCEWKGEAEYRDVVVGGRVLERAAWLYPEPFPPFEALAGHVSFYPAQLVCTVDGVRVRPQPGGFYGGWVTPEIVGPMKGEPGTAGW